MLRVTPSPPLAHRTTIRLGGPALAEISLDEAVDCFRLPAMLAELGGAPMVLGAGSNIIAADGPLPLVLIRPRFMQEPQPREDDGMRALVRVGAGVRLPHFLGRCAAWGLGGLEGLCGIPGTVGGAIAMNAGSFGCAVGSHLHSLRVYSPATGVVDIMSEYLKFNYRQLRIIGLSEWFLIVQATFALTHAPRDGITQSMRHNFFKKKSTQPLKAWSAGCVFKNPTPETPAGMLLEQAGFKGKKLGGMAFSNVHANFLVNEGKGSGTAALELMALAEEAVRRRFGVRLEAEVRILACPSN